MCQHITVILRNAPGEFAGVTKLLKDDGINVLAFHVASSGPNSGYAQLACDEHLRALAVLTGVFHAYAYPSEVIAIRTKNAPGSLYDILSALDAAAINIENAYNTLDGDESIIIIEPARGDLERAEKALPPHLERVGDFKEVGRLR